MHTQAHRHIYGVNVWTETSLFDFPMKINWVSLPSSFLDCVYARRRTCVSKLNDLHSIQKYKYTWIWKAMQLNVCICLIFYSFCQNSIAFQLHLSFAHCLSISFTLRFVIHTCTQANGIMIALSRSLTFQQMSTQFKFFGDVIKFFCLWNYLGEKPRLT